MVHFSRVKIVQISRVFLLIASLGIVGLAACAPERSPQEEASAANPWETPVPGATPAANGTYVGSAACQPCHSAQFAEHGKSRHATTLNSATVADLGARAPKDGTYDKNLAIRIRDGALFVEATGAPGGAQSVPISFALGSGKTGITFLALSGDGSEELRRSYFPGDTTWRTTPGQEKSAEGTIARHHDAEVTRQCLSCHAVSVPTEPARIERKFFGVGCESCHGAGGEHIAQIRSGKKQPGFAIDGLIGATGERLNEVCGKCHRTAADVAQLPEIDHQSTNRFQPFGLSLSRCFKASEGKLSCATCHDSHINAETNPEYYERTCISCHGGTDTPGKQCPVNPTKKCIECHMPKRSAIPNNTLPIRIADHFIRVYKKPTK